MFESINVSATGMESYRTWLDVIADNVANVNDTTTSNGNAFRTHYVQVQENGTFASPVGTGVHVQDITEQANNGVLAQDPSNPLADSQGYVRRADVDLSEQMGEMIMTQRAFQANASMVDRAKDVYEAAIGIGKNV